MFQAHTVPARMCVGHNGDFVQKLTEHLMLLMKISVLYIRGLFFFKLQWAIKKRQIDIT
jgi:hypothetical protein